MSFFQQSVQNKYLLQLDDKLVNDAYQKYSAYFLDAQIQENIRDSKEEQFQEGFLRELFVNILGYIINPTSGYNLTTELKNEKGAKKADGAIIKDGKAIAVIELKGTDTIDLDKVTNQAFNYKNNQSSCVYVVTSNFEKLRLYINDSINFEEFHLFTLSAERFKLLWLCLSKDSIFKNIPLKIKEESSVAEENITKQLYKDYSAFRNALWSNLVQQNTKFNKLLLFKKTQKLLDRFLFIFFAEDKGLLPPNSIAEIVKQWEKLRDMDEYRPLYERFKKYFGYLNTGHKGKEHEIFAYNGGLFLPDEVLDIINISDEILHPHITKLSSYNYESEIDVNILGHIFEHSLTEIDTITAEIEGKEIDKGKTKRKKDGVFYTPKYITKYIVESTLGKLCIEKKSELGISNESISENFFKKNNKLSKEGLYYVGKLNEYRTWLLNLKIVDPACGSGAFLNQALDFLINEHNYIESLVLKIQSIQTGGLKQLSAEVKDIQNEILENNIFGVDINEESVEIAKLSLWLRTAQPGRKLSSLNNNIKCGNSLIDDPAVAGEKAFNWQKEFKSVFENGGFDVVIGNPPYGAYLDKISKIFFPEKYKTFQGNYEIYFFFIELLDTLLKKNGKAGYITPDTWINIPQAKKLREHVLSKYGLDTIMSFQHSVFSDASLNAIIFILTKDKLVDSCEIINIESKLTDVLGISLTVTNGNIDNWVKSEDKQFQIWQNETDIEIIKKINKKVTSEEYLDVCQGIVPYSTENLSSEEIKERIFHSAVKLNNEYGQWAQGRALTRYGIDLRNTEFLKYGEWLHRARKSKYFNGKRILIQEITGGHPPRITASIFEGLLYHDPGIISCLNLSNLEPEYLLALINSKLISWHNLKTAPKGKRMTFPKVLIGDIRKFPLIGATEEERKELILRVNNITMLTSELQKNNSQFTSLLQSKFDLPKLTTKLENWHTIDFKDFSKELKKAKVSMTLPEEAEWMNYFNEQKQKTQLLQAEIDKTDKEIDRMVYALYELTEEEIKIVEGV